MKKVVEDKTTIHEVSWGFSSFFFQYENICFASSLIFYAKTAFASAVNFHFIKIGLFTLLCVFYVARISAWIYVFQYFLSVFFFFHFIVFHFHFSHCVSCILKIDCWRTSVSLIMWFVEKAILHKFTWQLFFFHALETATDASSDWHYMLDSDSSTFNPQSNVHF